MKEATINQIIHFIDRDIMKYLAIVLAITFSACNTTPEQNHEVFQPNGKAIKGYDPVAFHTDKKPVIGNEAYSYKWNDAQWLFASQAHLDSFKLAPEKYAPQYGGYCAFGTAEGHKAPTETDTWTIVNDKLYFNYNKDVKEAWNKDTKGYIEKAEKNWPKIKNDNL
jgi:YHS domain-containing protein